MSVVSNFVGSISPELFSTGGKNVNQNVDLGDTTFSDILEKQITKDMQRNRENLMKSIGMQSGININDLVTAQNPYGMNSDIKTDNKMEAIQAINETDGSFHHDMSNPESMSTSEVVTFFKSLFDSKPTMADTSSSGLFDYERKIAAGKYDRYAKNIVTDLNEFVTDTIKMKS